MGAGLAILSAVLFALAAALQQTGEFHLARRGRPVTGIASLLRLVAVPVWLLGTAILLTGYLTQGAALDRGRLVVIQPLMVLTIVFALPLGHWLTGQHVSRRQVWGALAVVVGLALFTLLGDPDEGRDAATPEWEYLVAAVGVSALAVVALLVGRRARPSLKAAALGVAAGLWFGLSATFTKPTVEELHDGISDVLSHPEVYGLLGFGLLAFVVQQLSLATGQLAPAMAGVSVANPAISVILGVVLFDERLTRPFWHVIAATLALLFALYGAVLITMGNREQPMPGAAGPTAAPAGAAGSRS